MFFISGVFFINHQELKNLRNNQPWTPILFDIYLVLHFTKRVQKVQNEEKQLTTNHITMEQF